LPTLAWTKRKTLNELIKAINEKDELLDSQEDFLIEENKKIVKLKNAYAQEVDEREIGLHLFLYEFWWLNCPTQINWTN
jgi:hypothetical protein